MSTDHNSSVEPFWQRKLLSEMSAPEWESLCDGCGRCCLVKLEDEDTGEIHNTALSCALLDTCSARCTDYANRHARVDDCVRLSPDNVNALAWLPSSCAYRTLAEGRELQWWHPLISGTRQTVQDAGISIAGKVISEEAVDEDDVVEHMYDWPNW